MAMQAGGSSRVAMAAAVALGLLMVVAVAAGSREALRRSAWPPAPDAVVSKDCRGAPGCYNTIGLALARAQDLVPEEKHRFVVLITAGTYEERLNITRKNVALIGEGMGKTVITGRLSNGTTRTPMYMTATVNALGHGFLAQNLTIRNEAGAEGKQAVALRCNSNKAVVYGCSIEGFEDTLYAENWLQFYLDSEIHGTVDFIYGNAKAVFQGCKLLLRKPIEKGKHNVITAQGCNDPEHKDSGFVFHRCTVEADKGHDLRDVETYLGRPYRNYSHVVFMESFMTSIVFRDGWVPWTKGLEVKETTESVMYIEYRNSGPGADTSRRVRWKGFHVLTDEAQAASYGVDRFIFGSDWIPRQIPYEHGIGGGGQLLLGGN